MYFSLQGLDVLEIMRHIQEFVTMYAYNLNNQVLKPPPPVYDNISHTHFLTRSLLSVLLTISTSTPSTFATSPTPSGLMVLAL